MSTTNIDTFPPPEELADMLYESIQMATDPLTARLTALETRLAAAEARIAGLEAPTARGGDA